MFNRKILLIPLSLALVLVLISLVGCIPKSPLSQKNPITVLGSLEGNNSNVKNAEVILTKGKLSVVETVPLTNNKFEASLKVPVGQWDLSVILVDKLGMPLFQSKPQTINVTGRDPISIELILRPADSIIFIEINLDDYIFREKAMRARIHFNDDVHEIIRDSIDEPLGKEISLSPGSYEFKIELYSESFRAGDKLGIGMWEVIDLAENETKTITWYPEVDEVIISGKIETLLPAPKHLQYSLEAAQVTLTWDPILLDETLGYLILVQKDPLERFELLNPTPIEDHAFTHVLDESEIVHNLIYVVAGVTRNGLVGYYSKISIIDP